MTEPVQFQAPDFDRVANYPAECRDRFMQLSTPGHQAPKWQIDKVLDAYLLWMEVYSD